MSQRCVYQVPNEFMSEGVVYLSYDSVLVKSLPNLYQIFTKSLPNLYQIFTKSNTQPSQQYLRFKARISYRLRDRYMTYTYGIPVSYDNI